MKSASTGSRRKRPDAQAAHDGAVLAGVLSQLAHDPSQRQRLGANARAAHEALFRTDVALGRWEHVLAEVSS